jgi:peptidoglycan/xylan/chitin deacetylase (PgdA/CDA1 family)
MGSLVLSLDAELGWGFHHHEELPVARIRDARERWLQLRDCFDEFEVPATWAVVGHLFLEDCQTPHEGHPAGERLCQEPPGAAEDLWYARDLIDRLRDAAVDHDIGAHGFTHLQFQHEAMTGAFAAREFDRSARAARAHGVDPTSFVYPVNKVGYRELLAEHGYDCYRGQRPDRPDRARKLAGALTGRGTPPIVQPRIDEYGLVDVPASMYLFSLEGPVRGVAERVSGDPVANWAVNGLERLSETEDGLLHLWLHPHNVTGERDVARLRAILERAATLRDRGEIEVETMADVAERTLAGE